MQSSSLSGKHYRQNETHTILHKHDNGKKVKVVPKGIPEPDIVGVFGKQLFIVVQTHKNIGIHSGPGVETDFYRLKYWKQKKLKID
jgi:hypothetical protein